MTIKTIQSACFASYGIERNVLPLFSTLSQELSSSDDDDVDGSQFLLAPDPTPQTYFRPRSQKVQDPDFMEQEELDLLLKPEKHSARRTKSHKKEKTKSTKASILHDDDPLPGETTASKTSSHKPRQPKPSSIETSLELTKSQHETAPLLKPQSVPQPDPELKPSPTHLTHLPPKQHHSSVPPASDLLCVNLVPNNILSQQACASLNTTLKQQRDTFLKPGHFVCPFFWIFQLAYRSLLSLGH